MNHQPALPTLWWRFALFINVVLSLVACSAVPDSAALPCDSSANVPWVPVAEGVWVWPPEEPAEVSSENGGHVVSTSVVVSKGEAMVIDPGPSLRHGERVRQSVECQFKAEVRWVVNTHAHSENVLANVAFADAINAGRTQVLASAPTREGMTQRCPSCLASLKRRVGEEGMAGTSIVLPTQTLRKGDTLAVGEISMVVVDVALAHTEGDLVLWWPQEKVAWVGGLVYDRRVPELAQGQLVPWVHTLDRVAALEPTVLVGVAFDRVDSVEGKLRSLLQTRAYLAALFEQIWHAMDEGMQANEAQQKLHLPEYSAWVGYAERQGFNVLRAWRELEPRWMDAPPDSGPPQPASLSERLR